MTDYEKVVPGFIARPQGGGPQPVLSDEDVARMVHLHVELNWSRNRIAREMHVHRTTVVRYLRGAGVEPHPAPHRPTRVTDPDELLHTLELAGKGYSARDIAYLIKCHPTTVRMRLRKFMREDAAEWRGRPDRIADNPIPKRL
jgi:hypothetical protein